MVLLGLLLLAYLVVPPKLVEFTKPQIDQELAKKLPYEINKTLASITVHTATLQLMNDNKIAVLATFDAKGITLEGTGRASFMSAISYNRGQFFLSDLKHEDIDFDLSQNSTDTLTDLRSLVENTLLRETQEANSSGDADRIESLRKANEYYETRLETDIKQALDSFLQSVPVYDLNNAGGGLWLAALALDDVGISDSKISVTLSLQTLIKRLGAIVALVLFYVVVLLGPLFPFARKVT